MFRECKGVTSIEQRILTKKSFLIKFICNYEISFSLLIPSSYYHCFLSSYYHCFLTQCFGSIYTLPMILNSYKLIEK